MTGTGRPSRLVTIFIFASRPADLAEGVAVSATLREPALTCDTLQNVPMA
jgi:hypothetical protein